jgi:acyl-CoA-dependent ceramide synthase
MYNSSYWLSLRALWHSWPTREMSGLAKWYYLVQFAFSLQQIVVVNIEKRRKDHVQMFTHHIITCTLIFTSYGYHQTKVGNLILCLADVVDLFLPLAKIQKYLKWTKTCDVTFGIFMVTWFVARHVLYMAVCWSIYAHIPEEIQYGCYRGGDLALEGPVPVPNGFDHLTQPFRDPEGLVCWNDGMKWVFLGLLLALQCVFLVWFSMILKVAYKVVSGGGADEPRSDDEDDDEDEEEEEEFEEMALPEKAFASIKSGPEQPLYLEKEVLSTDGDLHFSSPNSGGKSPVRRSSRKKTSDAHTTSVNLLDRKELLGRIGCDKNL